MRQETHVERNDGLRDLDILLNAQVVLRIGIFAETDHRQLPGPEPDAIAREHGLKSSIAENHAAAAHRCLLPRKARQLDFFHALRRVDDGIDRSFAVE